MPPTTVLSDAVSHGQHVCGIVGSSRERAQMVNRFVYSGLAAGDRVWCFPNACRPEALGWLQRQDVADDDLMADDLMTTGQLTVLPTHQSVLSVLGADPAGVIAGLRRAVEGALEEGWNGFRMVGDLGWATRGQSCARHLLDFEARVGDVLDGSPAATLCQYDRYRFDPDTMLALTEAHAAMVGTIALVPGEGLTCTQQTWPDPGLEVAGEVDLSTHEAFSAALDAVVGDSGDLHLDLSEVSFIDNGGAQILIRMARRLGPARRLVLQRPPQSLTMALTLLPEIPNLVLA